MSSSNLQQTQQQPPEDCIQNSREESMDRILLDQRTFQNVRWPPTDSLFRRQFAGQSPANCRFEMFIGLTDGWVYKLYNLASFAHRSLHGESQMTMNKIINVICEHKPRTADELRKMVSLSQLYIWQKAFYEFEKDAPLGALTLLGIVQNMLEDWVDAAETAIDKLHVKTLPNDVSDSLGAYTL